ncbi:BTAD domain-containing putative transcriptional regulator [Streptomyces roseolus]|uniref:BTAD domain-containing putative transcriptional regulator n=1 Tax=Streptomyces roseolus TaxID=67358 RepID=UPI0036FAA091
MLGPLEITADDQSLALGGSKQRATLGFLLLRVNKVVATSQLLKALWPEDEAPNSARKILQNTVWGLRRVLAASGDNTSGCDPNAPWVVTQQPGYMLRVSTDQIDLFRFRAQVEEGRARLAAGKPDLAAQQLKDALALWRGPVLADLVEGGVCWPELAAVQGTRLDALEDYFEAELARGRHQAILGELETLVETEPLRERACGQLMLALYRCGRQADALSVYARVRAELVENLGLEPGHDLRLLHQAILNQDPELILPSVPMSAQQSLPMGWSAARPVALADLSPAATVLAPPSAAPAAPRAVDRPRAEAGATLIPAQSRGLPDRAAPAAPPSGATAYGTGELAAPAGRSRVSAERKWLGVLLIRTEPTPEALESPGDVVDRSLAETSAAVREEVERLNGTLAAAIGSVSLALFGVRRSHGDDTARAVRAALAVRDRLAHTGLVEFRAAIDTGEVLVHFGPDDETTPPRVSGRLLDGAQTLLAGIPAGEIHASAGVHHATETAFSYLPTDGPGTGWKLTGPRRDRPGLHTLPIVDREYELELLSGLVELAEHRAAPHLVTLVGADGVGKTRLVMELGRRVAGRPDLAQFLAATTPAPDAADAGPLAVPAELLRAYCGILPGDPPEKVRNKLARPLRELPPGSPSDPDDERALSLLLSLFTDAGADADRGAGGARTADVLDAWRSLLVRAARVRPVVIAVDDLHLADDLLLDCLERLPEAAGPVPLVVVAAARPELRERRPVWGAAAPHTTTLTLAPLSDTAVDRLLDLLVTEPTAGMDKRNGGMLHRTLQGAACHPPADRRRQVRELLRLATPLPERPTGDKSPESLVG